jgi:hypothetical protein
MKDQIHHNETGRVADHMYQSDTHLVRVTNATGDAGSFIWEICRGDGLLVLQRSTKTFPTLIQALLDSAQSAVVLALDSVQHLPLASSRAFSICTAQCETSCQHIEIVVIEPGDFLELLSVDHLNGVPGLGQHVQARSVWIVRLTCTTERPATSMCEKGSCGAWIPRLRGAPVVPKAGAPRVQVQRLLPGDTPDGDRASLRAQCH